MKSLSAILRAGFEAYRMKQRPRLAVYRWAFSVMACRTAALGGHVLRCPEGHVHRVQYNSCKHRACPQCNGLAIEQWLENTRTQLLLDCDYYHLVFTVPAPFQRLWRWNREAFGHLLFGAVRDTVMALSKDPRWLGSVPGVILSLHTWGRSLNIHPHIHALVTGGGWTPEGWRLSRRGYLLPLAVVHARFRGLLLARVRQALREQSLVVPKGEQVATWERICNRLSGKRWNVHLAGCYRHGQGVLTYLARYVRGGPLKSSQILRCVADQVTFRYKDHRSGRLQTMTLACADFIARLAEHVPEHNFHMVRYVGIYASGQRQRLAQCRQALGMLPASARQVLSASAFLERLGLAARLTCPVCGNRLVMSKLGRYSGMPPPADALRCAA